VTFAVHRRARRGSRVVALVDYVATEKIDEIDL
jgi:hypothetical protein